MPDDLPGLGPRSGRPQPTQNKPATGAGLRPEDWFLLSRIDGKTDLQSLLLLSPKGEADTVAMLKRLLDAELISLPGAQRRAAAPAPAPTAAPTPAPAAAPASAAVALPTDWPTPIERFPFDAALMALPVPLDDGLKRQLLYVQDQMRRVNHYQLFGVAPTAHARDIKAKYLRYAKAFHPDRFFRQDLGPWRAVLEDVYRWVNAAAQTLQDQAARSAYDASLQAAARAPAPPAPSTAAPAPSAGFGARPASQLTPNLPALLKAKRLEREGDVARALTLYEGALARKRSAEVLLRAAECMLRLRDRLSVAEQYCREAIQQDSQQSRFWAALAYAVELQGRAAEAATHYRQAVALDPTNRGAQERLRRLTGSP